MVALTVNAENLGRVSKQLKALSDKVEGKKSKCPLDGELQETLNNMNEVELKAKLSEVAMYRQLREQAMSQDPDVQERKKLLNEATADYRDEIKGAKAQIKYITELLEARGKA